MARPPMEIPPSLTAEAALERLRRWPGLKPVASWSVSSAIVSAALGEPETLHLVLVARGLGGLTAPVEVGEEFQFSVEDHELLRSEARAAHLRAHVERLQELAARARADEAVRAWIGAYDDVIARVEIVRGEERLVFRAPTPAGSEPPVIFPPIGPR